MDVSIDQTAQELIQREIDLGHFRSPQEVISHALELLEAQEEWLQENRTQIHRKIEVSLEQLERGEIISGDEARKLLAAKKQKAR